MAYAFMNQLTFKITFQRQLSLLSWMLTVYGILLSIYLYFFGFTLQPKFSYIFLALFLLDICPAILVHIQYLRANWHSELTIDKESRRLIYATPKKKLTYHFEDINSIQHVSSYGGGAWYSFSEYRYFKIGFKDKQEIIITCLMVKDIKYTLERLLNLSAQKKLRIVAFIYN